MGWRKNSSKILLKANLHSLLANKSIYTHALFVLCSRHLCLRYLEAMVTECVLKSYGLIQIHHHLPRVFQERDAFEQADVLSHYLRCFQTKQIGRVSLKEMLVLFLIHVLNSDSQSISGKKTNIFVSRKRKTNCIHFLCG